MGKIVLNSVGMGVVIMSMGAAMVEVVQEGKVKPRLLGM